jgi:hypothetical protein
MCISRPPTTRCRPSCSVSPGGRRRCTVAIGKPRKPCLSDTAPLDRGGSNLSRRRRHLPRALGGRALALAIRAARRNWRRCDRVLRRRCGCAVGPKGGWRPQSGLSLVHFWNRRPRRGGYDGGNDLSGAAASPCSGGTEPPHLVVSARDGNLRCPTGPDAPRPRSVAAAAADGRDNSAGHGVTPRLINGAGEGDWMSPPQSITRCSTRLNSRT